MAACVRACVVHKSNALLILFFFLFISPAKGRIFIQHLLLNIIISNDHRLSDFTTKERENNRLTVLSFAPLRPDGVHQMNASHAKYYKSVRGEPPVEPLRENFQHN